MKKSILLLGICSVLLLGACSETPMADVEQKEVVTNDTASIQAIIDEAQAKFAQAQQQQHAWSSTADHKDSNKSHCNKSQEHMTKADQL